MTSNPTLFQKYNFEKVKQIWSGLSNETKETIFKLEDREILSDLCQKANNACLTCQLDKNYKKKDLIVWEKDKITMTHTYHFNFIRKDVVKNSNIEELLSSFYLKINLNNKQPQGSSEQNIQKSFIAVKKENLDLFIETLYKNISILNASSKELFKSHSQFEFYTVFSTQSQLSNSGLFDDIDSIMLQDLFYAFLAIGVIFLENVSTFISNSAVFTPALIPPKGISTQLSDLALILNSSNQPLSTNIKSVSEIERAFQNSNSQAAESDTASKDNQSNFSSSPRSSTSERKGSRDLMNELNLKVHIHPQRGPGGAYYDRRVQQGQQERIVRSAILRSDTKAEPLYSSNQPVRRLEDESPNNAYAVYNGLTVGDLSIDFKLSDGYLVFDGEEDEDMIVDKLNRKRSGSGTLINGDFTLQTLLNENHGHGHYYRQPPPPHFMFPHQPHFGFYPIIYAPPPNNNLIHSIINEPIIKRANNNQNGHSSGIETSSNSDRKDGRERSIDSHSSQGSEKEPVKNIALSSSSSYNGENYNRNLVKEAEKLHSYPKDSNNNNNNKAKVRLPPRFKKLKD